VAKLRARDEHRAGGDVGSRLTTRPRLQVGGRQAGRSHPDRRWFRPDPTRGNEGTSLMSRPASVGGRFRSRDLSVPPPPPSPASIEIVPRGAADDATAGIAPSLGLRTRPALGPSTAGGNSPAASAMVTVGEFRSGRPPREPSRPRRRPGGRSHPCRRRALRSRPGRPGVSSRHRNLLSRFPFSSQPTPGWCLRLIGPGDRDELTPTIAGIAGSRSPADRVHEPLGLDEPRGVDFVPFPLPGDTFTKHPGDVRVGRVAAEQGADIGLFEREEAVA
jgi:hypothetical protein